jgi:hypothetical protein
MEMDGELTVQASIPLSSGASPGRRQAFIGIA